MIFVFLAESLGFILARLGARGRFLCAWVLGVLAFDVLRVRRTLIMTNLARAFGAQSSRIVRAQVGRASVVNLILTTLEFFAIRRIFTKQHIEWKNPEILHGALARGQGVYVMGVHTGNIELLGRVIATTFARLHVPVKPIGKGRLAQWVKERRSDNGVEELVNGRGQGRSRTRQMMDALNRNELVGFFVDQRRSRGSLVPFFGEPAWTNVGLILLWKQRKAPVIPVSIARRGWNQIEVTIHEELVFDHDPAWSVEQYVQENAKKMNAMAERMILSNPKEYFWIHDRWKK